MEQGATLAKDLIDNENEENQLDILAKENQTVVLPIGYATSKSFPHFLFTLLQCHL